MIDVEMWAIKDTEKNTLVVTKWGRNTWKRKVNPDSVNIVGYKNITGIHQNNLGLEQNVQSIKC